MSEIEVNKNESYFSRYGKLFQEKIFQCLLTDKDWAAQVVEMMKPSYFDVNYLVYLTEKYFSYYEKYKSFPTLELLATIVKEDFVESNNVILRDQIVEYLIRIKSNPYSADLHYVKDKTLDFCKKQAFKQAFQESFDLMQNDNYEAVLTIMKKAVSVGLPSSTGHDFFEDVNARFVKINRQTCPTGLPQLDDKNILNGGLGKGELGVVVANTGVGKCVVGDTNVTVRYMGVSIDGKRYKPWEKVQTSQGEKYAILVGEGEIRNYDVIEVVTVRQLFEWLEVDCDSEEQELVCKFPLEIKSFDGFYNIEALRTTELLPTIKIELESGQILEGARNHRVMSMSEGTWTFLENLSVGDRLIGSIHENNELIVKSIERNDTSQILFDFQVAICHSFVTNDILSHNSHWLVNIGANAMRHGKNVVHYTFELSEHAVGLRYDSNLCRISSSDVQDNKEFVLEKYSEMEDLGRLIIKEYPTGSATVNTIRNHIEKLMFKGFIPSIIVIDYADIMKSTRSYDSLRHELKLIYEELRNLSMDLNIPIWTASQANRDSANSEIVGLENMGESYGKAQVADVVLSLSRKSSEKAGGTARLFVAKNRAGRDGLVFPLMIDTSMSTFEVMDENSLTINEMVAQSESNMKTLLKNKWKEVKNE